MIEIVDRSEPTENIEYKGYSLVPSRLGKGWRVEIFPAGSSAALPESPVALEKCSKEEIITEAKKIVDVRWNETADYADLISENLTPTCIHFRQITCAS